MGILSKLFGARANTTTPAPDLATALASMSEDETRELLTSYCENRKLPAQSKELALQLFNVGFADAGETFVSRYLAGERVRSSEIDKAMLIIRQKHPFRETSESAWTSYFSRVDHICAVCGAEAADGQKADLWWRALYMRGGRYAGATPFFGTAVNLSSTTSIQRTTVAICPKCQELPESKKDVYRAAVVSFGQRALKRHRAQELRYSTPEGLAWKAQLDADDVEGFWFIDIWKGDAIQDPVQDEKSSDLMRKIYKRLP